MATLVPKCALIVDGLTLDMDSESLKTMFAPYGEVMWTTVVMDRYGRSLRCGYVVMADEAEALNAVISLNGKTVGTQSLIVAMTDVLPVPQV